MTRHTRLPARGAPGPVASSRRYQPRSARRAPGTSGALWVPGVAAAVAFPCAWVWVTAEIAGRVSLQRWPSVPVGAVVAATAALPRHAGDPPASWAGTSAGLLARVPGSAFYLWGAVAAVAMCALGVALTLAGRHLLRVERRLRGRFGGHRTVPEASSGRRAGVLSPLGRTRAQSGAQWASATDAKVLRVSLKQTSGRLVLGRRLGIGGGLVATEQHHSVLVIGPTQSGKTTSLAVPALIEWDGPVLATSVKDDLVAGTLAWRSTTGTCSIFDPTRSLGPAVAARWSPLSECRSWSGAQKMATWLVESTPGRRGMSDAAFWYTAAAKQLAPLMLAAASSGMSMADVVRWTDSGDFDEPLNLLVLAGHDTAVSSLGACAGRDERIRSSVGTTLETVLVPFADPVVADATAASDFDIDDLLSGRGTLYLCGPSHEQARVAGLFAALVSSVVAHAVERVNGCGRRLDPPLLVVLDEAANIAPIADLDTLASTAAGLGIQLVTICQDLAQLSARYDAERARTIANNHRAKLLLSGVSDLGTLDMMSGLAGEQAVQEVTVTRELRGGPTTTAHSTALRRLAPPDRLRRVVPGEAVLVYGHLPPMQLRLRPWYSDRRLARRVGRLGTVAGGYQSLG